MEEFISNKFYRANMIASRKFNKPEIGTYWDNSRFKYKNVWYYPYIFSKGLSHHYYLGLVEQDNIYHLQKAIINQCYEELEKVEQSECAQSKMEGVLTFASYNIIGDDSMCSKLEVYNNINTEPVCFEMIQVYAMALVRNVPFANYNTNNKISSILYDLNLYENKSSVPTNILGDITPNRLFKGNFMDELLTTSF